MHCPPCAEDELEDLFARASNEALAAFGDGGMFVEKYLVGGLCSHIPQKLPP